MRGENVSEKAYASLMKMGMSQAIIQGPLRVRERRVKVIRTLDLFCKYEVIPGHPQG